MNLWPPDCSDEKCESVCSVTQLSFEPITFRIKCRSVIVLGCLFCDTDIEEELSLIKCHTPEFVT